MSGAELAAVLCGIVALGATAALAVVCVRLERSVKEMRGLVEAGEQRLVAAAEEAADAATRAAGQVDRLERLIDTAEGVSEKADAALRVLTNPVIKGAAAASGTRQAARRLRSRRPDDSGRD